MIANYLHVRNILTYLLNFFVIYRRRVGIILKDLSKATEFGEKHKIRAITPFKVIQGHRGRYLSKARMRLPISD